MSRCLRCNKFLLFAPATGYCKDCDSIRLIEKKQAEEEKRRKEEEERKRKAEEERRRKEEEERKRKAEEEKRQKEEEERKRKAEEEKRRKEEESKRMSLKPGNEIKFGKYFISNENTKEPIEWIVLECNEDKALLISKYGIDVRRFHYDYIDTTWEASTIRKWLNNEFIESAFSSMEKSRIVNSLVANGYAENYHGWQPIPPGLANRGVESTTGGKDTQDKVFLLSYKEAYKYFKTDEDRIAIATQYSKGKGAAEPAEAQFIRMFSALAGNQGQNEEKFNGTLWWTRSPGMNQGGVTVIDTKGKLMHSDNDFDNVTIRPAMWIKV